MHAHARPLFCNVNNSLLNALNSWYFCAVAISASMEVTSIRSIWTPDQVLSTCIEVVG